ncbi:MAG: hypothetical protein ACN6I7_03740 [bacterium]
MKRLILGALLCALSPFALAQNAATGLPAQGVTQLFSCNLAAGQNMEDVWSLLEAVRDQITEPRSGFSLFLWTPFRGATGYDYIWGATDASLTAMMEGMAEYARSPGARLLGPRFAAVNERCDSVVLLSEQMKAGAIGNTADRMPDAMVETFACRLKPGATQADVRNAAEFWQQQVPKIASADLDTYEAYMVIPFRGGSGEADFGWIGNYPDMTTFGRGETAYMNAKEGQAANERFEKVSTCRTALWNGYWVMTPAP